MGSTTGAYGDFPDYYYSRGNLFGSYLLGPAAPMSWDTRKELEMLGGGHAFIKPRKSAPAKTPGTPRDVLIGYLRAHVSAAGAHRVLTALAAARGVELAGQAGKDPYDALDDFALKHLTIDQQRVVLGRLRCAVADAEEEYRKRQRQARQERSKGARGRRTTAPRAKAKAKAKPAHVTEAKRSRAPEPASIDVTRCSLCDCPTSQEDRSASEARARLLLGRVYCAEHREQVLALFANREDEI